MERIEENRIMNISKPDDGESSSITAYLMIVDWAVMK